MTALLGVLLYALGLIIGVQALAALLIIIDVQAPLPVRLRMMFKRGVFWWFVAAAGAVWLHGPPGLAFLWGLASAPVGALSTNLFLRYIAPRLWKRHNIR